MSRWRRYEPLVLLAIPVIWALVVCREAYMTDPDSYLHIGCARRLVSGGCIRTFPWLPYTTLADPFPNMYLGQHALLAPFASVLPPGMALRAGVLVLSSGLAASLYLVLRRHGVARPAWWVLFGLVAVPQPLIYTLYIKGAATFLILLVWFVDAVWAGRTRRTFVLAWLSVYVYVGATVLVPFAIVHVFVVRGLERRWTWSLVGATLLGLTAGMFAHPGWPAHWLHIARELRTMVEFDPRLVPGVLRGAEWVPLVGPQIASLVGPLLVAWCVVLVRRLAERCEPVPSGALSATIAMLGLLGASLISGTKMLELAAVFSILALPRVAGVLAWPRWVAPLMVALGIALCVRNVVRLADELARPGFSHPRDYEDLAAWLAPRTDPDEVIVVPWDDMPGLFLYGADQRYVAGWNVQFLRDGDPRRFDAYYYFFTAQVRDPERLLPTLFDGARFAILRRSPRHEGEARLLEQLAASSHFEEIASPVPLWRIFRVR